VSERLALPEIILSQRVIPVARRLDASRASLLADALVDGGIHSLEVTIEGAGGYDAIRTLASHNITVGAGTVTSVDQAETAFGAGATFLVSPHYDETLVRWSVESRVPFVSGAMTPTEIWAAWSSGVAAVKVFPASIGGPGFIRALLGPYPDLLLIPTGGVGGDNAAEYLSAGAMAVGVGGWLTAHEQSEVITERAAQLLRQVV